MHLNLFFMFFFIEYFMLIYKIKYCLFFFYPQTKRQTLPKTDIDNHKTLSLNRDQSAQKYNMPVSFKLTPLIFPNNMEIRAL